MPIPYILLTLILLVVLTCEFYARKLRVPTQVSFPRARRKIVAALQEDFAARPRPGGYSIVDLGSGGGQLCRQIARALPDSTVVGIEFSPLPWLRAIVTRRLLGPSNLRYLRQDFWSYDCAHADAVMVYLNNKVIEEMGWKLRRELKPGTLIIVNDEYLRGDWQPVEVKDNPIFGIVPSKVYVYRQP